MSDSARGAALVAPIIVTSGPRSPADNAEALRAALVASLELAAKHAQGVAEAFYDAPRNRDAHDKAHALGVAAGLEQAVLIARGRTPHQ